MAAIAGEQRWTRVSSFKPQLAGVLLALVAACSLFLALEGAEETLAFLTTGTAFAVGLIALTCKVIHKRGDEYRVSTLYYSEIVTVDDVCMTVTRDRARFGRGFAFTCAGPHASAGRLPSYLPR